MTRKPTYEELEQRIKLLEKEAAVRKRVEKELAESEERFRTVTNFTYDWEYWIGPGGDYLYISPSCERITGYSPEDFQKDPGLLETITHPDDKARLTTHIREESGQKQLMSFEFRIFTRSGEERWIAHVCQQVHGRDGCFLGRRASNRDVTNRKRAERTLLESEARYKGIFEYTSSGVAVYRVVDDGKDFVFVDFNKSAEKIEKIRKEDLIGKSLSGVFPGVKDFGLFEIFQRVWATGKPEHFPVSLYKDERIVGWRDNFVYKLPSGEIVAVYTDETERKQAEEALRKAHEELYEFSQVLEKKVEERTEEVRDKSRKLIEAERLAALGKMANRVAHELRNPLTVVGGFARRMNEKTADVDPNKKYLKIILGEVQVLENKVSEIIKIQHEAE